MLIIAKKPAELDFAQLMAVYAEGNQENGEYFFPEEPAERQMALAEEQFGEYLRNDFFHQEGAFYSVLERGGAYVSALRLEPYADGLLLEALETRPGCRRMGYARRLMELTMDTLRPGTKLYSHVSKRNTASLAVHRSCGFEIWMDYAKEVDGTVTRNLVTLGRII